MRFTKIKNLSAWKETIFSSLAIAIFLLVFYSFPSNYGSGLIPFLQTFTKAFFTMVLGPFLFVKFILKKDFGDFGFNLKNKKNGFISAGVALVFSLILSYILISYTDFLKFYQLQSSVVINFWMFLLKELIFVNLLLFAQEYFYKGFVLTIFSKKFLYGAIFMQALLYLLPQLISGQSFFQIAPAIIMIFIGGIVAYLNQSFFYSYLFSLLYLILLDSYVIHIIKNGL